MLAAIAFILSSIVPVLSALATLTADAIACRELALSIVVRAERESLTALHLAASGPASRQQLRAVPYSLSLQCTLGQVG